MTYTNSFQQYQQIIDRIKLAIQFEWESKQMEDRLSARHEYNAWLKDHGLERRNAFYWYCL